MRVAVDVMGGDHAPDEILTGCFQALEFLGSDDVIMLVGDEDAIAQGLASSGLTPEQKKRFQVVHTTQTIDMDESPVEAIRSKPDSSISVMCKLASKGEADIVISAGNTGACVAASQLRMRLLPGVSRPGIAVVVPTVHGPVVVCDVGANIQPKPKHLQQYAIMAAAYSAALCGVDNPRVGLLSIGEEDAKGTQTVKDARKLMRDEPLINFVGNIEGRDIFRGIADVVVCDGFVGNIVLKFTEGMAEGLFQMIITELQESAPQALEMLQPVLKTLLKRHDWQEYGGAPLLGIGGYSMICHGRSKAKAIKNAIRVSRQLYDAKINDAIVDRIAQSIQVNEEE